MTSSRRDRPQGPRAEAMVGWAIWPCDHGDVLVEPGRVPPNYTCAECGAKPINVVPAADHEEALDALDSLLEAPEPSDLERRSERRERAAARQRAHAILRAAGRLDG